MAADDGLVDDLEELGFCGVFAGGHVGKKEGFGVARGGLAFHDSETGEGFIGERGIRLVERGVGRHAEVISAGKNYIARGIVNTGDQSGCGVRAKGVAGGLEVGGGDGGDWGYIREGIVKGESGVYNGVV